MSQPDATDVLFAPDRLAALAETELMGSAPEAEFDRLTDVVRRALGLDAAVLNLLDDRDQFSKSACDTSGRLRSGDTVPLGETFCEHVVCAGTPLVVQDLRDAPWTTGRPNVTRGGVAAYVGVPLRLHGGEIIGVLSALSHTPRRWSEAELALIEDVAAAIATEIRLRAELRVRSLAESALREREGRLRAIFEASPLGIAILDEAGRFREANPALVRMLGYTDDELADRTLLAISAPEVYHREQRQITGLLRGRSDRLQTEMRYVRKDGATIWGRLTASRVESADGGNGDALGLSEDVTDRKEMETSLRQLALTDELTQVSNRGGFLHLAKQQWKLARKKRPEMVLLFMDLDGFKPINDSHGHGAGDQALREVSSLLRRRFRESDLVARIGGDEFVVLAVEAECDDRLLIARLETSVQQFNAEGRLPFSLQLSVGVVRASRHSGTETLAGLLLKADQQMYDMKRARREAAR
jgi:diguanylate cyclase (GGDEF)-like protein/PAS domain S-box-containing protein